MHHNSLPVAIIGGGPIGLAAAAHLTKANIPFILLEQGGSVGQNFLSWSHVRLFSPWRYNIDKVAQELLLEEGWTQPDLEALPTGGEMVNDYFLPLVNLPKIEPHIFLNSKVLSVNRKGFDKMKSEAREAQPYVIKVDQNGVLNEFECSAIFDTSGTWNQPNPIGSGGVFAEGEAKFGDRIFYGIPDVQGKHQDRYKNKRVMVVGSGHSAVNALLDLAEVQKNHPSTQLFWVLRKKDLSVVYGGQADDDLEARGELGTRIEQLVNSGKLEVFTPFHIFKLSESASGVHITGKHNGQEETILNIDEIIANTGSRPNLEMIREIRTDLDSSLESVYDLAPLIDPNVHSCGTVRPHGEKELRHPEKDFYILGSKSYGRAPSFLMATGYEQVRSVVAYLKGDYQAAVRVELELPETGVCGTDQGSGCCSTPSPVKESCC